MHFIAKYNVGIMKRWRFVKGRCVKPAFYAGILFIGSVIRYV